MQNVTPAATIKGCSSWGRVPRGTGQGPQTTGRGLWEDGAGSPGDRAGSPGDGAGSSGGRGGVPRRQDRAGSPGDRAGSLGGRAGSPGGRGRIPGGWHSLEQGQLGRQRWAFPERPVCVGSGAGRSQLGKLPCPHMEPDRVSHPLPAPTNRRPWTALPSGRPTGAGGSARPSPGARGLSGQRNRACLQSCEDRRASPGRGRSLLWFGQVGSDAALGTCRNPKTCELEGIGGPGREAVGFSHTSTARQEVMVHSQASQRPAGERVRPHPAGARACQPDPVRLTKPRIPP